MSLTHVLEASVARSAPSKLLAASVLAPAYLDTLDWLPTADLSVLSAPTVLKTVLAQTRNARTLALADAVSMHAAMSSGTTQYAPALPTIKETHFKTAKRYHQGKNLQHDQPILVNRLPVALTLPASPSVRDLCAHVLAAT